MLHGLMARAAVIATGVLLALLLAGGIDRLIVLRDASAAAPNVAVEYNTTEFSVTATMNSLGIRDREYAPEHRGVYRVLAVGDSFTFGWGVSEIESWVKVLETQLTRSIPIEIINAGYAGAYPRQYPAVISRLTPRINPDLVLVAILSGDDAAQELEPEPASPTKDPINRLCTPDCASLPLRAGRRLFPNLLGLASRPERAWTIRDTWRTQARQLVERATVQETARWGALDASLRSLYLDGLLNPGLLYIALKAPDHFSQDVSAARPLIANTLATIRAMGERDGFDVLAVVVPYRVYISEFDQRNANRTGVVTTPGMLTTNTADDIILDAAADAGVSAIAVTNQLRRTEGLLYFPLDGHFTARGNAVFAQALEPYVRHFLHGRNHPNVTGGRADGPHSPMKSGNMLTALPPEST